MFRFSKLFLVPALIILVLQLACHPAPITPEPLTPPTSTPPVTLQVGEKFTVVAGNCERTFVYLEYLSSSDDIITLMVNGEPLEIKKGHGPYELASHLEKPVTAEYADSSPNPTLTLQWDQAVWRGFSEDPGRMDAC